MEQIHLDKMQQTGMTIMIFVEGTILNPKSWLTLYHHRSYVPTQNSVEMIKSWYKQGANIVYCTSRRNKQAYDIASLLKQYGFVGSKLCYRSRGEKYKQIVEAIEPAILIEDDAKSIGGAWQRCITYVSPEIKKNITSIIVPEFKGIAHLSLDINLLKTPITR